MPAKKSVVSDPSSALLGPFSGRQVRRVWLGLAVFLLLLVLLAWLIRYPDVLSVPVVLQAEGKITRYDAALPGRIEGLPVREGQEVAADEVLLVWEGGGADWEDVVLLGGLSMPGDEGEMTFVDALELGPLEAAWAEARAGWRSYRTAIETARALGFDAATRRQLTLLEEMEASLQQQKTTAEEAMRLAEDTWLRTQRLADSNAISRDQAAEARLAFLDARANAEGLTLEYQQVLLQKESLKKELEDVRILDDKSVREQAAAWQAQWEALQALGKDWEARHVLRTAKPGRVRFRSRLEPGQWLEEGAPLMAIEVPGEGESWMARGWLPAAGAGRVDEGAEADLRLEAFPYEEYGCLQGIVRYISPLAENGSFLVEIEVSDPLISDTGRRLAPGPEMPATARIFTSKKRLLQRLLEGFKRI